MAIRVYLSNLAPRWPINRQEELLRAALPGYPKGVTIYRDELDSKTRQGHAIASLVGRMELLRPTRRKVAEDVYVAALGVLAWGAEDLLACLTAAAERKATIHVLQPSLVIAPDSRAGMLAEAVAAFNASRRQHAEPRGVPGSRVSGERRQAAAKAKAETIRARWALPSVEYPTAALLAEAGLSRNTAKLHLGRRDIAQEAHQSAIKRKGKRHG